MALKSHLFANANPHSLFDGDDDQTISNTYAASGQASGSGTTTTTLYLTESGDTAAISVNDLHQGSLGDCFLIASIGELALLSPATIQGMIKTNTNGTESVALHKVVNNANGTVSFQAVTETVTNTFPATSVDAGTTLDVLNGVKEIWPQVLENAVATLDGGYTAIANGGSPVIAMEQLTGQLATAYLASTFSVATLTADITAKDMIIMDTSSTAAMSYGLTAGHSYFFESVKTVGGVAEVQLGNPWGSSYNPQLIPETKLASAGIFEIDIGKV